jgi:hypothetical protein
MSCFCLSTSLLLVHIPAIPVLYEIHDLFFILFCLVMFSSSCHISHGETCAFTGSYNEMDGEVSTSEYGTGWLAYRNFLDSNLWAADYGLGGLWFLIVFFMQPRLLPSPHLPLFMLILLNSSSPIIYLFFIPFPLLEHCFSTGYSRGFSLLFFPSTFSLFFLFFFSGSWIKRGVFICLLC